MKITVAMTPRLLCEPQRHAVAVVDVLRATTSLVTMFEGGLLRAMISENVAQAHELARRNFSLLCGEVDAVPPDGFDYGNSPAEFANLSFKGKSAVLYTTNGTRAIHAVAQAPVVIAAALVNRRAAAQRLLAEAASRDLDIAIVCAGVKAGVAFSLEDTAAAGAIVEAVCEADAGVQPTEEALAAMHLWQWYDGDTSRMFRESAHGRLLARIGFDGDLRHAAQIDISEAVPVLYDDDGVKTLRARPPRRA
jgi:2-phosphosulfolactate phosphatase